MSLLARYERKRLTFLRLQRITQSDALDQLDTLRSICSTSSRGYREWRQYDDTFTTKVVVINDIPLGHLCHHLRCQMDRHLIDEIYYFVYDASFRGLYLI
jgi:hypothetical protein